MAGWQGAQESDFCKGEIGKYCGVKIMQNNLNEQEEYADLVDENDKAIGRMPMAEARRKGVENMRVVNAFLVNSKGELWIPRRAAEKEYWPLWLDMSVGGHVSSGETYEEALK